MPSGGRYSKNSCLQDYQRIFGPLRSFFLLLLLTFAIQASGQSKYIKKFRPVADSLSIEYGIPSAVILGVALVESSSGSSKTCKLLNNHFGIMGKNRLMKTKKIKTRYKQYPNAMASYIDFCKVISRKKFYPKLKGNTNVSAWLEAISKTGYSEKPEVWKKRIMDTIIKYSL